LAHFQGHKAVDFFERWFGFSGGRGDGSLEFVFLVVVFAIIVLIGGAFLGKANVDKRQRRD
jgi:hypothetical protein